MKGRREQARHTSHQLQAIETLDSSITSIEASLTSLDTDVRCEVAVDSPSSSLSSTCMVSPMAKAIWPSP